MPKEYVFPLDKDIINLFSLKGMQGGTFVPQIGKANGLKVRRVMQLIRDFSKKPFNQLRILDLACGEGVYSIEAALRGAEVRALDARIERMNEGAKVAERLNLKNLCFEQTDIRDVNINSHGKVDIVLLLGILYHLDQRDMFRVMKNIYEMVQQFILIDTHISLHSMVKFKNDDRMYEGKQMREHADDDPQELRRSRLLSSLDNPMSFWFTKESLFRLLNDVGFTSVCECNVPLEPFKPIDRVTLIAAKGERVKISSYPWVNDKSEDEIEQFLVKELRAIPGHCGGVKTGIRKLAKSIVNGILRPLGIEIKRI